MRDAIILRAYWVPLIVGNSLDYIAYTMLSIAYTIFCIKVLYAIVGAPDCWKLPLGFQGEDHQYRACYFGCLKGFQAQVRHC